MMHRKSMALLGLLTLFCMLLTACGGSSSGSGSSNSGTITVWGMGTEGDSLKVLANDFMKQNPNIHVQVQAVPWGNAHQKFLTSIAGNQTPDGHYLDGRVRQNRCPRHNTK
jgi:multiple sugar transport system substrate-binding protein